MFAHELAAWKKGLVAIGVDEVGRGALAGPIVAAACAVVKPIVVEDGITIRDSKKMTKLQREKASTWLSERLAIGIGLFSADYINEHGISIANNDAMIMAVNNCLDKSNDNKGFVYTDNFRLTGNKLKIDHKAVQNGDNVCFCISAASIIAKVYRDDLMKQYSHKYPHYDWHKNMGYGTQQHISSLRMHGPTPEHRSLFISKILAKN